MKLQPQEYYIPEKLFLTKKLLPDTLKKVLGSSLFTVIEIFKITNNQDTKIEIYEPVKLKGLSLNAHVNLNWAYSGPARAQIKSIRTWTKLALRRPSWHLKISLYSDDHKSVYSFSHTYTNIDLLHQSIEDRTIELEGILSKNQ